MNNETLVYIASSTKAFTSLSCALLVEQNKLAWDKPLVNYIPSFETTDEYITKNATIVDLLSHRTGIKEFANLGQENVSRSALFAELKNNAPNKPFRKAWQYNNSMYGIVGHIIELLSEKTWEDFVKDFILSPLEMTNSDFSFVFDWKHNNRTKLYIKKAARVEFVPPKSKTNKYDTWGPAGSINSNTVDMGKWLMFLLNEGVYHGNRLVLKENFKMMIEPHCITDTTPESDNETTPYYGLGWFIQNYKGKRIICHKGSFGSFISFLPDKQIGVTVLANMDSVLGRDISYSIYDMVLNN
jgi:CubicO group peptidase (beta-lactamase class C family)